MYTPPPTTNFLRLFFFVDNGEGAKRQAVRVWKPIVEIIPKGHHYSLFVVVCAPLASEKLGSETRPRASIILNTIYGGTIPIYDEVRVHTVRMYTIYRPSHNK